jgi:hypothetical protein
LFCLSAEEAFYFYFPLHISALHERDREKNTTSRKLDSQHYIQQLSKGEQEAISGNTALPKVCATLSILAVYRRLSIRDSVIIWFCVGVKLGL